MKSTKKRKNSVVISSRPNPKMGCKKGVCIQCLDYSECRRRRLLEPILESPPPAS
ncbi:MAG: hypothetical protein JXR73_11340 [Candidatus Omnitrophica bacterium]|nr:hypothetical protein [Candidatus Omnitrophota bacterium]